MSTQRRLARLTAGGATAALVLLGGLAAAGAFRGDPAPPASPGAPGSSIPEPTSAAPASAPPQIGNGKGTEISELATTTDATGVEKGAEISDLASDGQSRAGEDHPSAGGPPSAPGSNASPPSIPVSTPTQAANGLSHRP